MSKKMLRVGDTILCRANFGSDAPKKEVVKHIDINCNGKDGESVEEVAWADVKDRTVIVDMENGHWAYGSAISPTTPTKRAQFKEDVEAELDKQLAKAKDKILSAMNSGCINIEQDSPHTVLTLTSAILKDLSDGMFPYSLGGNKSYKRNFKSEVDNIIKFL